MLHMPVIRMVKAANNIVSELSRLLSFPNICFPFFLFLFNIGIFIYVHPSFFYRTIYYMIIIRNYKIALKKIQFRIFWHKGIDIRNFRKKEEGLASSFRLLLWK